MRVEDVVRAMSEDKIRTLEEYKSWIGMHREWVGDALCLPHVEGIKTIDAYVKPSFHPRLPLVLLGYTKTAHNTLHTFPGGWSRPIMQCRGIVYDLETVTRVALPFEKFFGNKDHPEAGALAEKESHVILSKEDGHLGIIFSYRGQILLTTRGEFTSLSAKTGRGMLARLLRRRSWKPDQLDGLTMCVEMIHPTMRLFVEYGNVRQFVLLGVTETQSAREYDPEELRLFASKRRLTLPKVWEGTIPALEQHLKDRSVTNREGYVAWFPQRGLRIKYKYETHLGKMFAAQLSEWYVMRMLTSGEWNQKFAMIDKDIQPRAKKMADKILGVRSIPRDAGRDPNKTRRKYLHELVFEDQRTSYYKSVCRRYLRHLDSIPA
jgi:hypothetical protein